MIHRKSGTFKCMRFAPALAFLAPVGVMLAARLLAVQPPALLAQSNESSEPIVVQPIEGPSPTPKQLAARQRGIEIAWALMDTTPMYYQPRVSSVEEVPVENAPAPTQVAPAKPRTITPPQISMSSIIRAADGQAIAFLNGKMHRVGDSVGNGWKITAIDPKGRRVTIDHDEAEAVEISLIDQRRQ